MRLLRSAQSLLRDVAPSCPFCSCCPRTLSHRRSGTLSVAASVRWGTRDREDPGLCHILRNGASLGGVASPRPVGVRLHTAPHRPSAGPALAPGSTGARGPAPDSLSFLTPQPSGRPRSCPWWRSRVWLAAPFSAGRGWSCPATTSCRTPRSSSWRRHQVPLRPRVSRAGCWWVGPGGGGGWPPAGSICADRRFISGVTGPPCAVGVGEAPVWGGLAGAASPLGRATALCPASAGPSSAREVFSEPQALRQGSGYRVAVTLMLRPHSSPAPVLLRLPRLCRCPHDASADLLLCLCLAATGPIVLWFWVGVSADLTCAGARGGSCARRPV